MNFIVRLKQSPFVRNFVTLATGTAIAQAISILSSPVLTRVYSPHDFGLFAVFMAIVSSFTPVLSGKYEVALLLPKDDKEGLDLLGVAFWFCVCFSLFFFVVVCFGENILDRLFDAGKLGRWIFALPAIFLFTGCLNVLIYFANRSKKYTYISKANIVRSSVMFLFSASLGMLGCGFAGFIIGLCISLSVSIVFLLFCEKKSLVQGILQWDRDKYQTMIRYKDFPLYNATSGLLDGITLALPVFFLSHYFSEATVGFYALVVRVGTTPLFFISNSISQVNLKQVVDIINSHGRLQPYLLKLTGGLVCIAVPFIIILEILAPKIFIVVFGNEWGDAGSFLQILLPAMGVRFIASTLSSTLGGTNNNKIGMIWKVLCFCVTFIVFTYFSPKQDIVLLLKAVVVSDIFLYILYYILILYAANSPKNYV